MALEKQRYVVHRNEFSWEMIFFFVFWIVVWFFIDSE